MNYEIVHYTQKKYKNYNIPSNLHEIVKANIPRDFDIMNLVKQETTKKIINDEMNDFNFYNIPYNERIDPEKLNKTGYADFKSVHKLQAFNEKRGISTTNKFFKRQKLSDFERNIRTDLKKTDKNLFLLREIYEKFDNLKTEAYQKPDFNRTQPNFKTQTNENFEKEIIQDLENWEHDKTLPLKTKESSNTMKKSTLPKKNVKTERTHLISLPSLAALNRANSILYQDSASKEKLLKFARNEQFKDETLGKTLINYIKAYESPEIIRNRLREREQTKKSNEKTEEKLGLSVIDLSKQVTLMFLNSVEGTLIDRTKGYKQLTTGIMIKVIKKIKDSEAFLNSRSLTMMTIRKENSYILDKLKSIKGLMISLKEKISKNIKRKTASTPSDSGDVAHRISVGKKIKLTTGNSLLTAEKTNIEKFMEKALDEQIKEEEINQLNESKIKFEQKLNFNNQILFNMENENQVERKNLKETQKLYKNFLFKLLNEGKDCRNNGLTWIVLELWKIGENIYLQHLPKFLDQKGKEFILSKAKKEQELTEISTIFQTYLENFQGVFVKEKSQNEENENLKKKSENLDEINEETERELKERILNKSYHNEKSIIDQECADSLIKESKTLSDIFQSRRSINDKVYEEGKRKLRIEISPKKIPKIEENVAITVKKEILEQKEVKDIKSQTVKSDLKIVNDYQIIYIENDKKINEYKTKDNFFKESEGLERKIKEKRQNLIKMEKSEIIRIIKEFDYQEYGFKYSTDCESVLSALIGARKAYIELIRYGMLKKN